MMTDKEKSFLEKANNEKVHMLVYSTKKPDIGFSFATNPYSPYDGHISGSMSGVFEVKCRNYSSCYIARMGGVILEEKKLIGILQATDDEDIYYFNFFKDVVKVYRLPRCLSSYTWINREFNNNDFNKQPIVKSVALLPDSMCIETLFLPTWLMNGVRDNYDMENKLLLMKNKYIETLNFTL